MSHANLIVAVDGSIPEDEVAEAVADQMEPFCEEEWFGDGSRWDWYVIGGRWNGWNFGGPNIIRKRDLNFEVILASKEKEYTDNWYKAEAEKDEELRRIIYGVEPEHTTLEVFLKAKVKNPIQAYAFLMDREWHENERMGWFAAPTANECERLNEELVGKCTYTNPDMESRIFGYKYGDNVWSDGYYDRFIRDLPPDTWLVTVDYHV